MSKTMASKNIAIKKETYDKLLKLKGESESFTDVIEFLLSSTKNIGISLEPFFGIWKDDSFITVDMIYEQRDEMNTELDKRFN